MQTERKQIPPHRASQPTSSLCCPAPFRGHLCSFLSSPPRKCGLWSREHFLGATPAPDPDGPPAHAHLAIRNGGWKNCYQAKISNQLLCGWIPMSRGSGPLCLTRPRKWPRWQAREQLVWLGAWPHAETEPTVKPPESPLSWTSRETSDQSAPLSKGNRSTF